MNSDPTQGSCRAGDPTGSRRMSTSASSTTAAISAAERAQIQRANVSGLHPVVFVHGLWLLPSSWQRWAEAFEEAGYIALMPDWPDAPATVAEANANPGVMANKTVGQVADHFSAVIAQLERKPAVIGHSFGGLLAQILAGRGQSAVTVAIDPAPFRGVLPLPISALKAAWPVLGNPSNRNRAVPLSYEQFRYAFANAVSEDEAQAMYLQFAVPAPGAPLVISGEKDNTVPWSIANASFKQQQLNPGLTEIVQLPNRGHSLIIDNGWREVADTAMAFVR